MPVKKKKWMIAPDDRSASAAFQRETGLGSLAARVLFSRGVRDRKQAEIFLRNDLSVLHDPMLMRGMEKAVEAVRQAMEAGKRIAVYGDYDVDGITSLCLLTRYLRSKGADCLYYIPDRLSEGYGLNEGALRSLREQGVSLVITVDSGITAVKEAEAAAEMGLALVVTDHHECRDEIPDALAAVDPRQPGETYPFLMLAGVGVAFKLVCALEGPEHTGELMARYGDLVALGTIADVMPLTDENRSIVRLGLERLEKTENIGLRALMAKTGLNKTPLLASQVSFVLAPRINAAGRMGCADTAARLFLTDDKTEAEYLADCLCEQNRLRQETENRILTEVHQRLKEEFEPGRDKMIVMWGENWHHGVIGIVSSRVTDRYAVPTVLISMDGEEGKGSGRSVAGANLFEAVAHASEHLERYGGHELAVGLSICRSELSAFKEKTTAYAACHFGEAGETPALSVDCEVESEELSEEAVKGLLRLEPFGMGNPQPVFVMREVLVEQITPIGCARHLKLTLEKNGKRFSGLFFGVSLPECPAAEGQRIDIAFSAEINRYRGRDSVQLVLKDLQSAESEREKDIRAMALYDKFRRGARLTQREAEELIPLRQEFVCVYRFIRVNAEDGPMQTDRGTLFRRICRENRGKLTFSRMQICLDVFEEFGILQIREGSDGEVSISVCPVQGKADIVGSKILAGIRNRAETSRQAEFSKETPEAKI